MGQTKADGQRQGQGIEKATVHLKAGAPGIATCTFFCVCVCVCSVICIRTHCMLAYVEACTCGVHMNTYVCRSLCKPAVDITMACSSTVLTEVGPLSQTQSSSIRPCWLATLCCESPLPAEVGITGGFTSTQHLHGFLGASILQASCVQGGQL